MKKYEIEYEDAPSGNVTFYNYKEPLMKFTEGHGYVGALIFDSETDKVQCHFCGDWYHYLPPHLHKEHNMSASSYKEQVGLFQSTALISESMRAKLIASGLDKRLQNLRAGGKKTEVEKKKISETLQKNGRKAEGLNLRGTCPAQLIDRLKKSYTEQGDKFTFERGDNDTLSHLLRLTFGSTKEACRLAGIPWRKPGQNLNYEHRIKNRPADASNFVKEFIVRFGKSPTYKDFKTQGKRALYDTVIKNQKNLRKYITEAYTGLDEYRKPDKKITYTKKQLLDFMVKFEKSHDRKPSISDAKRCLIPYPSRYIYHFGSWKTALQLAFEEK